LTLQQRRISLRNEFHSICTAALLSRYPRYVVIGHDVESTQTINCRIVYKTICISRMFARTTWNNRTTLLIKDDNMVWTCYTTKWHRKWSGRATWRANTAVDVRV